MPDDHSEVVPLLPIPNRTVKRLSADDSADSRVKVGHRQANNGNPSDPSSGGFFIFRKWFVLTIGAAVEFARGLRCARRLDARLAFLLG